MLKVNEIDEKELKEFVERLENIDNMPEKRRVNIDNLSKLLSNMRDYRNLLVSSVGIVAFNMAHSANGGANQVERCRIAFGFIVTVMIWVGVRYYSDANKIKEYEYFVNNQKIATEKINEIKKHLRTYIAHYRSMKLVDVISWIILSSGLIYLGILAKPL